MCGLDPASIFQQPVSLLRDGPRIAPRAARLVRGDDEGIVVSVPYYIYILASKPNGTLYIGVTNDLVRRVHEHRTDAVVGFTKRYGVHSLVYFEECDSIEGAIFREKVLKRWQRRWKKELIERLNPDWRDLYEDICR